MSIPATVHVDAARPAARPLSAYLTGKFCEHLGSNIYNGMSAQILRNPTFARAEFGAHEGDHPDGGARYLCANDAIREQIERDAQRDGRFDAPARFEAWQHSLAYPWIAEGDFAPLPSKRSAAARPDELRVTPDVSPHGRAQRMECETPGRGIAQVVRLPLHRCRNYFARIFARGVQGGELILRLFQADTRTELAHSRPIPLIDDFTEMTVEFSLPADLPPETLIRLAVLCNTPTHVVLGRIELFPQDHLDEADPDVVRLLKESHLPILRWPGGNFVSGFDWRDSIGPRHLRPGKTNPAWGGVESNLFGLHEFITFCRHVGCEPMICVNAGNGTPEAAADWVEYCNGSAHTPLGKLRKRNGSAKPFRIRFWEVGNELTGNHQISWTTPGGYADRYGRFAKAMLARDPNLTLIGCGAPVDWREDWNDRLFRQYPQAMPWISDHILRGGPQPPGASPYTVYQDFMALPVWYESQYRALEQKMRAGGNADPRLAITELQLFARIAGEGAGPLTPDKLVAPDTMAEAVYSLLFYHMAVRLAPFVGMITHSATVNHGGGLRKSREQVFANPCHHAQSLFADFNGATAVPVRVVAPAYRSNGLDRCDLDNAEIPTIDAVAATTRKHGLVVSLINRGLTEQPLELSIAGQEVQRCDCAWVSAPEPWTRNTREQPERVAPQTRRIKSATPGKWTLTLPPYSVTRLRLK